jgi:PKD repeat protein
MSFADSKVPPGSTQSYRVSATDPLGNVATSDWVAVTIWGTSVANVAPTAAFTPTVAGSAVQVDGTGSSDSDGSIVGYAWDFGDGATATGATASHTYAASGTFTVKLTVTDNQGATGTAQHDVTVT